MAHVPGDDAPLAAAARRDELRLHLAPGAALGAADGAQRPQLGRGAQLAASHQAKAPSNGKQTET